MESDGAAAAPAAPAEERKRPRDNDTPEPASGNGDPAIAADAVSPAADEPAAKKAKPADEVAAAQGEAEANAGDVVEATATASGSSNAEPIKFGYKTFATSKDAHLYFLNLLHLTSSDVKLNQYEAVNVLDLLRKGHPHPEEKLSGGVKAVHVRGWQGDAHGHVVSRCFYVQAKDNTFIDFSYLKCLKRLFPGIDMSVPQGYTASGRGRGRGRSGGGGGRGGRGRGGRRGGLS